MNIQRNMEPNYIELVRRNGLHAGHELVMPGLVAEEDAKAYLTACGIKVGRLKGKCYYPRLNQGTGLNTQGVTLFRFYPTKPQLDAHYLRNFGRNK